ncbi:MAG: hypothetical protein ACRDHN_18535 [Thermomicrobiales bacterium]
MAANIIRNHPRLSILAAIALVALLIVGGYAYSLLDAAGELPWQEDPTRIAESIVPFSGLFETPTATMIATEVSTPAP